MEACVRHKCLDFATSTCAVYGDQDGVVLTEKSPQSPANSYGASKRAVEDMLQNFASTQVTIYHFSIF